MEHKASLNTSLLKRSSTIQGRSPGKETQHQCQMQSGGKWQKGRELSKNDKKKEKHNLYSRNKEVTRISDITAGDDKTESTVPAEHLALTLESSLWAGCCRLQHAHKFSLVPIIHRLKQTFSQAKRLKSSAKLNLKSNSAQRRAQEKNAHFFNIYIYIERVDIFSLQELVFNSPSHALESCKQYKYKWSSYNIWIPAIFKIDRLQKQQQIVWKWAATHVCDEVETALKDVTQLLFLHDIYIKIY